MREHYRLQAHSHTLLFQPHGMSCTDYHPHLLTVILTLTLIFGLTP